MATPKSIHFVDIAGETACSHGDPKHGTTNPIYITCRWCLESFPRNLLSPKVRAALRLARIRAWQRRFRAKNKRLGLCACGRKRTEGHTVCGKCLAHNRKYDRVRNNYQLVKDRRQMLRSAGLCIYCKGELSKRSKILCERHRRIQRERDRQLREARRLAGLCILCAAPRCPRSKCYCEPCLNKTTVRHLERRKAQTQKGLCKDCSEPAYGYARCLKCRAKHRVYQKRWQKRRRRCTLSRSTSPAPFVITSPRTLSGASLSLLH